MALQLYYAFGLGMTMTLSSCSLSFPEYSFKVFPVHNCPLNKEAWDKSSDRLKCNKTHGYHCVPNGQLTSLIEFCYPRGEKILFQEGNCLELAGSGILNHVPCRKIFSTGCPDNFYFGNDIYKYPKCLAINTTLRCFVGDTQCIKSSLALKNNLSEQGSTTEPMPKSTNNNSEDSVLLLIDLTASRQNSTTERLTNFSDIKLSILLIENNTFYKNSTMEQTASLTNSENSFVAYIVPAILLFVTTVLLVLVIFKRDTIKDGMLKCLRKYKLGNTDTNNDNIFRNHTMEESCSLYIDPETINYGRDENGGLYYTEPEEFYSVYTNEVENNLEPQQRQKTVRDEKLSSASDDGTIFEAYLNENQLNEAQSYTNHPDENTCANSNQIQTTDDLNNSHTEDIDIYDAGEIYEMEPPLEVGNVESCNDHPNENTRANSNTIQIPDDSHNNHPEHSSTPFINEHSDNPYEIEPPLEVGNVESCTDHPDENTRANSKTIQIPDDSHNNHPEHSSTPFNNGHSDNPDEIEPKPKPRLRYVENVVDNPNEKPGVDSNKTQNNHPKHDDTSYDPYEIDPETNCNHGSSLSQERPVQEKSVYMYNHCSDVHADDGKQTLKNNIQHNPSKDPNNDYTEQTNEEISSVLIEDSFEIVDASDICKTEDIKPDDGTGGCVIA